MFDFTHPCDQEELREMLVHKTSKLCCILSPLILFLNFFHDIICLQEMLILGHICFFSMTLQSADSSVISTVTASNFLI